MKKEYIYLILPLLFLIISFIIFITIRQAIINNYEEKKELTDTLIKSFSQKEFKNKLEKIKRLKKLTKQGFSLLSYIEETAKKQNIREKITNIKPIEMGINQYTKKITISLSLENISIRKAMRFLGSVENPEKFVYIEYLKIIPIYGEEGKYTIYTSIVHFSHR